MSESLSELSAQWLLALRYDDLPMDVRLATRCRLLDIIGLALAGATREPAQATHRAALELGRGDDARIFWYGERTSAALAGLVNGTMGHTLEFDDTHNETIVHVSVPLVTTALVLGDMLATPGIEIVTALAGASELATRIGVIAPGRLNRYGFHPTGIVGAMSTTLLAARMFKLTKEQTRHALGIAGSQAAGLMECWTDGTWSKFLHPGLSAQAGITAATLARCGFIGPSRVFEGRFGLFAAHVQDPSYQPDFERMVKDLGVQWESRNISFKPYPCAHVIHPFLDAVFYLCRERGLRAQDIDRIVCPIADYMVPIVCEPVAEKLLPASDWQGRVSLQYSIAEALYHGKCDVHSYDAESLRNPAILELAQRVTYVVDKDAPGRSQFKGWVIIDTKDGRRLERIEEYNRGSRENPMTPSEIEAKFRTNAAVVLGQQRIDNIASTVGNIEQLVSVRELVTLCIKKL